MVQLMGEPGAALAYIVVSPYSYVQRSQDRESSIQLLEAMHAAPCHTLKRAMPVSCQRSGFAVQARARERPRRAVSYRAK